MRILRSEDEAVIVHLDNARLIDARGERQGGLYFRDGRICEAERADLRLDMQGLAIFPSLVDMHTHLRDPGFPEKETMETGMRAAIAGGFGTLAAMANTQPVTETSVQVEENLERARKLGLCTLIQGAAAGKGLGDCEPTDYRALSGVTPLISNDGKTIFSDSFMRRLLEASAREGFLISTHCEPEAEIVARDIAIQKETGGRLHVGHISLRETLECIREAKASGQRNLSCEVTAHHIFGYDNPYRVNPPMRSKTDVKAMIEGLRDGSIDCLATDHAPHTPADKQAGMAGISCIDYAFYIWLRVFQENGIPLSRLSEMASYMPARLLGLEERLLAPGCPADIIVVDPRRKTRICPTQMRSRSKNTPFTGRVTHGCVAFHFLGGRLRHIHPLYADLLKKEERDLLEASTMA